MVWIVSREGPDLHRGLNILSRRTILASYIIFVQNLSVQGDVDLGLAFVLPIDVLKSMSKSWFADHELF